MTARRFYLFVAILLEVQKCFSYIKKNQICINNTLLFIEVITSLYYNKHNAITLVL